MRLITAVMLTYDSVSFEVSALSSSTCTVMGSVGCEVRAFTCDAVLREVADCGGSDCDGRVVLGAGRAGSAADVSGVPYPSCPTSICTD